MPSVRAFLRAPRAFSAALFRIVRTVVVAGFAVFALVLLAVRFAIFPQVESYRDTLASSLTRQLGHPVEIAALTTGWDGWNPKLVVRGFRVLDAARSGAVPLLDLPEIEMIIAWTSLPLLELRLKELVIDRPRLAIRRDRDGMVHVAGIEIDPEQVRDESPLTDWMLRQHQIIIRDALITWDDDQRNAPQLVLDRVQFRLENHFGRHLFGLKGTPPAELAAPLDLRGDIQGISARDWEHAEGRMFVRLDYADVAAWREWLPLPAQISGGKGAMRIWFQFARGELREIVADLELADVKARLAEQLPELDVAHLSGRAGWRSSVYQRDIFARGLAFTTVSGERLDPMDFTLTLREDARDRQASGQLDFDHLQLEPLVALGAHLPFSARVRAELARYAPHGTLAQGRVRWEGTTEAPTTYSASAEFTKLGFSAQDALPGVTGLNGRVNLTQALGEIKIAGSSVTLDLPRVFHEPIALDSVQSGVKWERRDGKTAVRIEQLEFANADATGGASGTYRTTAQGPGEIDIIAHASRVDARQVHRYLPRSINDVTRNWLRAALAAGAASEARLKVAGNVAEFPFANGKGGQLVITAKAKGVTLAYAEGWPAIETIDGEVRIEGTRLKIDAVRGHVLGVDIGKTRAEIDNLAADYPLLKIDGDASGPAAGFLRFVNESPVAARIGSNTTGAEASGNGRLALKLALPLGRFEDTKVAGDFSLVDAHARFAGMPELSRINGKLSFSERDIRAREVAMEVMGGPAKLAIAGADGGTRISGSGTLALAALRREYPNGFLDRVSGTADWTVNASVRPGASSWILESTMKGAAVDLPAPIGKAASDPMPLRIERRDDPLQAGTDFVTASYGGVARFAVHRKVAAGGAVTDRAILSLGRAIERPDSGAAERPGLWIRAELPELNVDDWVALMRREGTAVADRKEQGFGFSGADLDVGQLEALGVRFSDLKVAMREAKGGWMLDLNGREIAGTATWTTADAGAPNGRIVARLARLSIPRRGSLASWRGADGKDGTGESKPDTAAQQRLAGDRCRRRVDDFEGSRSRASRVRRAPARCRLADRQAGARQRQRAHRRRGCVARRGSAAADQTRYRRSMRKRPVAFSRDSDTWTRSRGAPTKINGQLAWSGAPHEFDYPSLAGTFRLASGPGRFTKIEPGPAGKLLGVLSLQALPRRVTLDFRDVFSDGFTFDEITGDRANRQRGDDDDEPPPSGPRGQGRHCRRRRSREGNTAPFRPCAAGAVDERIGGRRSPVHRQSAGRRGRRGRIASRADDAQGSHREDVHLRIRGHRRLGGSGRHAQRARDGDGRGHACAPRAHCRDTAVTSTTGGFRVAAVQTVSGGDVAVNLAQAEPLIVEAVAEGARLVVLPEYFGIFGARATDKLAVRETDGDGPQQAFLAERAVKHGIWLVGGTVPLACGDPARVRSACLVYGPDGRRAGRYDKIHLFAFSRGDERYDEGKTIEPGTEVVTIDLPCGRVGLSVCYDLRFPELYRGMGELALIIVPSAFTATTGAAHWHLLLRARAVENQCYVLAAAQGGVHPGGRRTYGHSLLIDPWGAIVAEHELGPGVVVGDVDPARLAKVREELPALAHRVLQ